MHYYCFCCAINGTRTQIIWHLYGFSRVQDCLTHSRYSTNICLMPEWVNSLNVAIHKLQWNLKTGVLFHTFPCLLGDSFRSCSILPDPMPWSASSAGFLSYNTRGIGVDYNSLQTALTKPAYSHPALFHFSHTGCIPTDAQSGCSLESPAKGGWYSPNTRWGVWAPQGYSYQRCSTFYWKCPQGNQVNYTFVIMPTLLQ